MKVALVHEWLDTYAGSERVFEQFLMIYPEADIFAVVDFLSEDDRKFLRNKRVQTTFIQKLPFSRRKFRNYLFLMPLAIEQLDLTKYDLVISSSHAVAKGILTGPNQVHISYIHSPIRYAWDMQAQYLKESNLNKGIKGLLAKWMLHKIRLWDYRTANGVDEMISNSKFISKRIKKIYGRTSTVIYPPVDIEKFNVKMVKEDFYLTASRMVPYKKMDLIVDAFSRMPDKKLIVIGNGSEYNKIIKLAGTNIIFLGYQPFDVLCDYMQRAKGFVFAAEEDFGIMPLEAQACGTPVIAFGKGGALETVRGTDCDRPTGILFPEQNTDSLIKAVQLFEENIEKFNPQFCRDNAERFSPERFRNEVSLFIEKTIKSKVNSDES